MSWLKNQAFKSVYYKAVSLKAAATARGNVLSHYILYLVYACVCEWRELNRKVYLDFTMNIAFFASHCLVSYILHLVHVCVSDGQVNAKVYHDSDMNITFFVAIGRNYVFPRTSKHFNYKQTLLLTYFVCCE